MKNKFRLFSLAIFSVSALAGCSHVHSYVFVEEVAPTCTEKGVKAHYECKRCDVIFDANKKIVTNFSLLIKETGHTLGENIEFTKVQSETRTDAWDITAKVQCDKCSDYVVDTVTVSKDKEINDIPSTCYVEGTSHFDLNFGNGIGARTYSFSLELADHVHSEEFEYNDTHHWHPVTCDHADHDQDYKEMHVMNQEVATDEYLVAGSVATCAEKALYYKSCVCGYSDHSETFSGGEFATHMNVEHFSGESHSCDKDGIKEHWHCKDCNQFFLESECITPVTEEQLIDHAQHDTIYHAYVAPKNGQKGTPAYYECQNCHNKFEDALCTRPARKAVIEISDYVFLDASTIAYDGCNAGGLNRFGRESNFATEITKTDLSLLCLATLNDNFGLKEATGAKVFGTRPDDEENVYLAPTLLVSKVIKTTEDLEYLTENNTDLKNKYVVLGADIECSTLKDNEKSEFIDSTFNGFGHVISNVKLSGNHVSLFGHNVENVTIKDVVFDRVTDDSTGEFASIYGYTFTQSLVENVRIKDFLITGDHATTNYRVASPIFGGGSDSKNNTYKNVNVYMSLKGETAGIIGSFYGGMMTKGFIGSFYLCNVYNVTSILTTCYWAYGDVYALVFQSYEMVIHYNN